MCVELNVAGLKEFVRINRDAVDLNMPMRDDFKIHYIVAYCSNVIVLCPRTYPSTGSN